MTDLITLNVSEIFYTLQGEGGRAGIPTFFIRLQGCKTKHACLSAGVNCDTEFESGRLYTLGEIKDTITLLSNNCKSITWTGGEPLDQLTDRIVTYFKEEGFHQSLETSGLRPLPSDKFDYVCISPKVAEHVLQKNFEGAQIHELRYVRHKGQDIPRPQIVAKRYFISPHSDGNTINRANLDHCLNLALKNPNWAVSVQMHKLWKVL